MLVRKALLHDASNVYDLVNSLSGDAHCCAVLCRDLREHPRLHGGRVGRRCILGCGALHLYARICRGALDCGCAGGQGHGAGGGIPRR